MIIPIAVIIHLFVCAIYLYRNMNIPWMLNPGIWFIFMQIRMILGSLYFVDGEQYPADNAYILTMLSVLIFFVLGSELRRYQLPNYSNKIIKWYNQPTIIKEGPLFKIAIFSILAFSIFIMFAYYYAIGFNVFLIGVAGLFTEIDSATDIKSMRLESYSEGTYYAPGYVNQFKNVLIPLLSAYLVITLKAKNNRNWKAYALILTPIAIIGTLGTGQRAPFLIAVIIILLYYSTLKGTGIRKLLPYGFLAIGFFMLSSLVLGRHVQEVETWQDIWLLFWEFPERILKPNQLSGVVGFREIYYWPTSWGHEMKMDFLGLLPGRLDYIPVAHRIHEVIYGSDRGTAPLTINGDLWLNFHFLGVSVFPLILGYAYTYLFTSLTKGPKDAFRILMYSAFAFILGSWCAGGVKVLIAYGFVTVLLLLFIGKISQKIHPIRISYIPFKLMRKN